MKKRTWKIEGELAKKYKGCGKGKAVISERNGNLLDFCYKGDSLLSLLDIIDTKWIDVMLSGYEATEL